MYRILTLIILITFLLIALFYPFKISYNLESIGTIYPIEEWKITQDGSGNLIGSHRYNLTGITSKINSWQFKAGDLSGMEVVIKPDSLVHVHQGDTLIRMYSTIVLEQILDYTTQINVLKSQTNELNTGEKQQIIKEAQAKLDFAKEQFVIKEKEYKIAKELFDGGAIASLEFSQKENAFMLAKIEIERATKDLQIVETGQKIETIHVNQTQIDAIQKKLDYLRKVNTGYVITAPFEGDIMPTDLPEDVLVLKKVKECLVEIPVKINDLKYIKDQSVIEILDARDNLKYTAQMIRKGTTSKIVDSKSVAFLLAKINVPNQQPITLGLGAKCYIKCDELSQIDYLKRALYYNLNAK